MGEKRKAPLNFKRGIVLIKEGKEKKKGGVKGKKKKLET